MRGHVRLAALGTALLLIALATGGCGGSSAPDSVSAADLQEDSGFWLSLDDELKRELAGICQSEQVKTTTDPGEAQLVEGFDTDDYVAKINDYYEEQDGDGDIKAACEQAKVALATDTFNDISPQLGG